VLLLLTRGKSNKEIARDLGLAEATVKFHLKNVFGKLGVSRRAMAISVARGFGFEG
jgi:LuxR family maltose regulon positive regulatory protein